MPSPQCGRHCTRGVSFSTDHRGAQFLNFRLYIIFKGVANWLYPFTLYAVRDALLCGSTTLENRRKLQIFRDDRKGTVLTAISIPQNNRSLQPTKQFWRSAENRGLNRRSVKAVARIDLPSPLWIRSASKDDWYWTTCLRVTPAIGWMYGVWPAAAAARANCASCCFGLTTFVLVLANSSRSVCGRSGSNRIPCRTGNSRQVAKFTSNARLSEKLVDCALSGGFKERGRWGRPLFGSYFLKPRFSV